MAVKFSENEYWNPAEWVSRTLFKGLVKTSIESNTFIEKELKEKINHQIKLYVWLLDFESYEPYKLEVFKELINASDDQLEIKKEFEEAYEKKILELKFQLESEIKRRVESPKWNEIKDWEKEGIIRKRHLEEWAFSVDGVLHDQHEDYLLSKPECLVPLFELLGMKWNRRNADIKNILIDSYSRANKMHPEAKNELSFKTIMQKVNLNKEQKELIESIKSS